MPVVQGATCQRKDTQRTCERQVLQEKQSMLLL